MKVVRLSQAGLAFDEAPLPEPGPGELLIRVHAAGVTPTELSRYPTMHQKSGEPRIGAIPGHEFSGVVQTTGAEVFGMNDWYADGATGEYCVAGADIVARKPARLSHAEAASAPIGALTAWQGLFSRANLRAGERVLIHGGAGAVGSYAVQLARIRGAEVVATASARNINFVKGLGASEVIDYRVSKFEDRGEFDIVFDTVGGKALERSWAVVRKRTGRLVTIADGADTTDARVKEAFFIVEPNGGQLAEIGRLFETGKLRPQVDTTVPFALAADAYQSKFPRQGRGKIVVAVSE
jgi:NADPH:quinone reductase-like Zn-dependent oxidoreductase